PPNEGEFGKFGLSGIMAGAGTIFFAYIGFDAVSTAAQEARNPRRDMPIGIIGSLAICTILYVAFSYVLTGMVNYKDLGVSAPVGGFLPLKVVGHMTSIGTLFAFVIVCAGVLVMRRTHPHTPRPFRTPLVPLVPILGIVWNFAMMYSLGIENWLRLIVWLAIG